jgi:hypothetical protein
MNVMPATAISEHEVDRAAGDEKQNHRLAQDVPGQPQQAPAFG